MTAHAIASIAFPVTRPTDPTSTPFGSRLAGDVQALCASVELLRHSIEMAGTMAVGTQPIEQRALDTAKQALNVRQRRERVFGPGLFSEPVWDILLELYIARAEATDVPVGNACLAASVPMTSALRWCQLLQDRAVIYRERDPKDGRRIFLRMTDESFAKLTALLGSSKPADLFPLTE